MKVFTVMSRDFLANGEPDTHCTAGAYTTYDAAVEACIDYILERLRIRGDFAESAITDCNRFNDHPGVRAQLVRHRDGSVGIRRGRVGRLRTELRAVFNEHRCYYVTGGNGLEWHFDVDEVDLEGQLWTTVTWGDSDCEDPEFTTPFPETFVSEEKAIANFYYYAVDLKKQYSDEGISEGFKPFVYDSLRKNGKCQVDLGDGCCVSCVLYSTPASGIQK